MHLFNPWTNHIAGIILGLLASHYSTSFPSIDIITSKNATTMTSPLKVGDTFPEGVEFSYIPYSKEKEDINTCGTPTTYNASKEFADKKVVLFSVPGAFTPGCSVRHLPGYIKNLSAIKGKGVDIVAVISYNDAFVLSAWSKANGVKGDDILFLSDGGAGFSSKHGWTKGERTGRYALIIDHGKVVYAENEPGSGVTVSGAEAVLAQL